MYVCSVASTFNNKQFHCSHLICTTMAFQGRKIFNHGFSFCWDFPSRWGRTVVQWLFACLPEWLLINYDTNANTSFWHTNNSQGPPSSGRTEVVVENDEIFQPPCSSSPKKKDKKKIPSQKKTFIVLAVDVVGPIINLSLWPVNLDADLGGRWAAKLRCLSANNKTAVNYFPPKALATLGQVNLKKWAAIRRTTWDGHHAGR